MIRQVCSLDVLMDGERLWPMTRVRWRASRSEWLRQSSVGCERANGAMVVLLCPVCEVYEEPTMVWDRCTVRAVGRGGRVV